MSDNTSGTQPATPNNRTGHLFTEDLLRRFLAYQFDQIRQSIDDPTKTFIEELFHKFGDDIVLQIKNWWRETTNLPVAINFPRQDMSLPWVCVVNAGENESPQAFLGDHGGQAKYGQSQVTLMGGGTAQRATSIRNLLSLPLQHTMKIYVATNDAALTLYLNRVIMALLLVNKTQFDAKGGAQNMVISSGDIEFHPEMFPEFAYFKLITLQYTTVFDVPLSHVGTIGGVAVTLDTFIADVVSSSVNNQE